jgi:glutathione S-transferase
VDDQHASTDPATHSHPEIFHLALPEDWARAQAAGRYEMSTRGLSLQDVGFVHCSTAAQLEDVANRFYRDVDALLVLRLDTSRLDADVRFEPPAPGSSELFPHVYGPIPVAAVVDVRSWKPAGNPTGEPSAQPAATPSPWSVTDLR